MNVFGGEDLQSPRITAVPRIGLGFHLIAGQPDLICIDNDDMIAGIDMRGKCWFVFSSQHASHTSSETAEGFSFCVDQVPLASNISGFFEKGLGHGVQTPAS